MGDRRRLGQRPIYRILPSSITGIHPTVGLSQGGPSPTSTTIRPSQGGVAEKAASQNKQRPHKYPPQMVPHSHYNEPSLAQTGRVGVERRPQKRGDTWLIRLWVSGPQDISSDDLDEENLTRSVPWSPKLRRRRVRTNRISANDCARNTRAATAPVYSSYMYRATCRPAIRPDAMMKRCRRVPLWVLCDLACVVATP